MVIASEVNHPGRLRKNTIPIFSAPGAKFHPRISDRYEIITTAIMNCRPTEGSFDRRRDNRTVSRLLLILRSARPMPPDSGGENRLQTQINLASAVSTMIAPMISTMSMESYLSSGVFLKASALVLAKTVQDDGHDYFYCNINN
jgi:hypothetical protein